MSTQLASSTVREKYHPVEEVRSFRIDAAGTLTGTPARPVGAGVESLLGRLSPAEWRRRVLHFAPGVLPFLSLAIPHEDPITFGYRVVAFTLVAALFTWAWVYFGRVQRPDEPDRRAAVLGYTAPPLLLFLLFPAHVELALAALTILAFGDGTATLVGKLFGRRRLPWNRQKTWAGTLTFLLVAVPLATFAYWGEARPHVPFAASLLCAGVPAVVAAAVESVPSRGNDNFRVAASAAVSLVLMQWLVVGITW